MDTGDWPQVIIEFTDRQTAKHVAVEHLWPALNTAQADGVISGWWFIRKTPYWKLRYQPADHDARRALASVLDRLADNGQILGWVSGIYEPEAHAFGGSAAMDATHELFQHDSRHILDHLARPPGTPGLGRRELGILLCSVLMRGAGLDLFEQGDVWSKVAEQRPAEQPAGRPSDLVATVLRLMTVDVSPTSTLVDGGALSALADWIAAFDRAGRQLADLALRGVLERGLRAVLAHQVIFAWNRLGLTYAEQHTLATITSEVVMGTNAASPHAMSTGRTTVGDVPTETTEDTTTDHLRNTLVDQLCDQGTVRTGRVEAALRAVERHLFIPQVHVEQAYADEPIYTKDDGTGAPISAASQPTIVAMMLEQAQVQPGQRVLELGAGTGYNAALLGHLVGEDGQVVTIDVDEDIVDGARSGLDTAGCQNVHTILGDGALGYPDDAPYDLVIATVGAGDLPLAWLEQLAPGGRLVVPMRLRGSVSRSIVFQRGEDGRWRSRTSSLCGFMPLRGGICDDPRRITRLTGDGAVTLQTNQEQAVDEAALAGVFDQPSSEAWTGVLFGAAESFEWLYLWLTCVLPNALSRMPTERTAVESGLVRPQFPRWGTQATTSKGDLAYLTLRPAEPAAEGHERQGRLYEVGVIGHGPSGSELVDRVADEILTWDRGYRSKAVEFEIHTTDNRQLVKQTPGEFAFDRPNTRLIVRWQ